MTDRDVEGERICLAFHVPYWIGLNRPKPSWFRRPIWRARAVWWRWGHHRPGLVKALRSRWWALVLVLIGIAIGNLLIPFHGEGPKVTREKIPPPRAQAQTICDRPQRDDVPGLVDNAYPLCP